MTQIWLMISVQVAAMTAGPFVFQETTLPFKPLAINDRGDIVGVEFDAGMGLGVHRLPDGTLQYLEPLWPDQLSSEPAAINEARVIVGAVIDSDERSFPVRWTDGVPTLLPGLPTASGEGAARDINDDGIIVGDAIDEDGESKAVKWIDGSVFRLAEITVDTTLASHANAINNAGQIAGERVPEDYWREAVTWHGDTVTLLSPIIPTFGYNASADDINEAGFVTGKVGASWREYPYIHYNFGPGSETVILFDSWLCYGHAINDKNFIVGACYAQSIGFIYPFNAFVWHADIGRVFVSNVLDGKPYLFGPPPEPEIRGLIDVNNRFEAITSSGNKLLKMVPDVDGDIFSDQIDNCIVVANPWQIDSDDDGFGNFCDPDLNNDGIVNFADVAAMKSVFLTDDPHADLNHDGIVNFADLVIAKSMFLQPPGPSAQDRSGLGPGT